MLCLIIEVSKESDHSVGKAWVHKYEHVVSQHRKYEPERLSHDVS